jgi:SAM-dependent methyltransferase
VSGRFDADWLALREPFDHAARSLHLARRLAERLPARPRLMDLGAGTGSMFRFLAPIIGRGQDWTLVDADAALLDDAFGRTAAWARRQHFAATSDGDALLVSTPRGLWRMRALHSELQWGGWRPLPLPPSRKGRGRAPNAPAAPTAPAVPTASAVPTALAGSDIDAVVCSALLDLVSARYLERLFEELAVPFLACLTVDGRDAWLPHHPSDAPVRAAVRRDQRRDKGFGPALGTAAPAFALRSLAARGFVTASAPSDWRIPRMALRMQRALIEGRGLRDGTWQEARLRQAMRGRLAITIGHRDILAFPPGG